MATKLTLGNAGYERQPEQAYEDWNFAKLVAWLNYEAKGRKAKVVKEAGRWTIYALATVAATRVSVINKTNKTNKIK